MTISIRIVHLDHYMAKPSPLDRSYSPFCDKKLYKVPVLRVFGSTKAGQKVCLHVHQVYPYFYVPFSIPTRYTTEKDIQKDIFQFGTSLNEAMNLAKPNAPKDQHVAAIVLTKGVPFYGYHVGYQTFLKIYLVQPQEKQQALDILQTGAIMNTSFQPFEAHLNFELQFLMDHNLYGMDWIDIDDAHGLDNEPFGIKFRSPLPEEPKASFDISQSSSITHHSLTSMGLSAEPAVYTSKTVPSQLQSDIVARESYCELEMDITGMSILNRQDLQQRSIHTSLKREKEVEAKNRENEQVSKLVKSLESIWKDETSRRRSQGIQDPISLATQISDREPDMPWLPNMQKAFNTLLSGATFNETSESQNSSALIPEVMTAFESVEALYPEEYFTYVQAKKEVKEQEDSNEPSCQSIRLPSSSIPTTPTRLNVSPRTATTPVSSQFNVSATPTRYKAWDLPSQLDKSVLNSCIRDSSLDELAYEKQPEDNPEDEDNYFTLDDDLSDGDIIDLLKQAEEQQSVTNKRYPTQIIEYEPENTVKYQPRRLDFIAETNKIDAILQPSTRPLSQKKSLFDNMENKPFEISDTPPDPVPRLLKSHRERSRHRINQTDGVNDPKEGDKKRIQSAAEKWELEKKALKKMRLKKQEVLLKARQPPSPPPRIPQLVVQVEQKRPSVEDHPMFQKVSVVISDSRKRRKRSKSHSQPVNETTRHKPASIVSSMSTATESISKRQPKPKEDNHVSKVPHYLRNQETRPTRPKISLSKSLNSLRNKDKTIEPHEPKLVSTKELTAPQTESYITKQVENNLQHNLESQSSDQTYFIKRIDGMWSSQEEPSSLSGLQFFEVHKPCPVSPTKDKKILIGEKPSEVFLMDDEPKEMVLNNNLSNEEIPHYVDNEGSTSFSAPAYHAKDTHVYSTPPTKEFIYGLAPPVVIEENIEDKGVIYQEPFYSKASDLPRFPTVFAGKEFRLPTCDLKSLKEFKTVYTGFKDTEERRTSIRTWTPSQDSPTFQQVKQWLHTKQPPKKQRDTETQLDYPTADNSFRFKLSAAKPQDKVKRVPDYIDYFSVEIHVNTRHQLLPDPEHDPVQLVFWCLQTEDQRVPSNGYQDEYYVGVIAMNDFDISRIGLGASRLAVDYTETEEQLFSILIGKVRYYDPDMLVGYETQNSSWGYLVERGAQLGYHLLDELSRVIMTTETIKKDQWGYKKASSYRILGRHMLNLWRLMRHELTLTSYTLENVAYHLLHHRIPHYAYSILTNWYTEGPPILKYRLFEYYMKRVQLNLEILDASQVISRMCESARVYGIDFYAVMTRGSQYNVESIMFRIAKPENFMLISPSRKQVASQRSLEILPLVMEPISQFYSSPMVVLDFQSLYPSIMIAYNYCYSTCLGRIRQPQSDSRFGVLESFELEEGLLDALKEHINVSPNGVMFVKPAIRKSLLAKMLYELLDTRAMVKRAMKDYKDDSGLLRMLDAKQLSLKLLANVTYGYTSASYSGRMPSVEIADSIVSTGRETLEKAIRLVNETEKWGARVIYGDTDSMFVYFPGKTKEEAFKLGREIADTVTKLNPAPVKLKFEKVYHPAVLLAKKRYVGFKYENETDTEPVFEAKGIETVRRDGIAATQKILESSLKILFRTQDMSELKEFLYRQWTKILSNRVPLQDFIIAKEVRMGTYSSRGGPNGAVIAQEQMNVDTRAEPQYGERVPYVVVYRGPNARLKDKVLPPEQVLADNSLRLDAEYYIRKQIIPPLARVFNLMGVDILSWYESMPRSVKVAALNLARTTENKSRGITRIDQYYASSHCIVCRQKADQSICEQCQKDPVTVMYNLYARQHATQDKYRKLLQTCENCTKIPTPVVISASLESFADVPCSSLDCPIFYQRHKAKEDVKMTLHYDTLMDNFSS